MLVKEKYQRPCFAVCTHANHGVIVLKDGAQSEPIQSIKDGKEILKNLKTAGRVSPEDAERIEDHLICSDLPQEQDTLPPQLLSLALLTLVGDLLRGDDRPHQHKCPKCSHVWEHGSECAGNEAEHTCAKCGSIQWR